MKFHEMEEKLKREKEKEKEDEASGSKVQDVTAVDHNKAEDELQRPASIDAADSLPGPVEVLSYDGPTPIPVEVPSGYESTESNSIAVSEVPAAVPSHHPASELPPIPHTIVEQERLELIEINNDGTSGHLTHSIEK